MQKTAEQLHTERLRGWILKFLNEEHPTPLELAVLTLSLDSLNFPLSRRGMARELAYLRSKGTVRVFMLGSKQEVDNVEQARLIQRYAQTNDDSEMGGSLCAWLTDRGTDFLEGRMEVDGILRVN